MKNSAQLEQAVLNLPPALRAQLALAAWESLETYPAADRTLDSDGISLAIERNSQVESGQARLLTHDEFRHLTGGQI